MNEDIEFSIIMPALNEEKNIELAIVNSLDALDHFGISGEIIVINDGSIDNTEALITAYRGTRSSGPAHYTCLPQGHRSFFLGWSRPGSGEIRGYALLEIMKTIPWRSFVITLSSRVWTS